MKFIKKGYLKFVNFKKSLNKRQASKKIIFPESKLAHKYLDGLAGLEIGGSAHNPFGLNTKNVDCCNLENNKFKNNEFKICGKILPVDIVSSGDNLPVENESQDFVISSHVLEHFYDTINVLKEWYRVIKKRGYIFIIVPHQERCIDKERSRTNLSELINRHKMQTSKKNTLEESEKESENHHIVWITEDAVELINYLGWKIVEIQDIDDKVGNGFAIVIQK